MNQSGTSDEQQERKITKEVHEKYYAKRKGYTWIVPGGMKYDVCRESHMTIGLTEEKVKRMDEVVLTDPFVASLYVKHESEVGVTHRRIVSVNDFWYPRRLQELH